MYKSLIQLIKFSVVGFSNTIISYTIYAGLTYIGVYYIVASIIGFIVSVLNSFFWNNRYVFTKADGEQRNIWWTLIKTFLAYGTTGFIVANILLLLFVEIFGISKYIAPIFTLVFTIPSNFLINKYWAFKTKKNKENTEGEKV